MPVASTVTVAAWLAPPASEPAAGDTLSHGTSAGFWQVGPPPPLVIDTTITRWKSGKPGPTDAAGVGWLMPQAVEDRNVGCVSALAFAPGKNWPPAALPSVCHSTTRSLPTVSSIAPLTGTFTTARPLSIVPLAVPIRVSEPTGIVLTGAECATVYRFTVNGRPFGPVLPEEIVTLVTFALAPTAGCSLK